MERAVSRRKIAFFKIHLYGAFVPKPVLTLNAKTFGWCEDVPIVKNIICPKTFNTGDQRTPMRYCFSQAKVEWAFSPLLSTSSNGPEQFSRQIGVLIS